MLPKTEYYCTNLYEKSVLSQLYVKLEVVILNILSNL